MKITKTAILVKGMDCPSEEAMIREQLSRIATIHSLVFDIPNRLVAVYHDADPQLILDSINKLSLNAQIVSNEELDIENVLPENEQVHRSTLKTLLAINGAMFVVEVVAGWMSDSMGLFGDGLDMLADASVYSLALFAVGRTVKVKNRITLYSGLAQLILAFVLVIEVVRKFLFGSEPLSSAMIVVSAIALFANAYCLYLITPHRHGEKYMTASWIFSANDVIINIGVIFAGILVYLVKSNVPDLIIGSILAFVVIIGAFRIMRLAGKQ